MTSELCRFMTPCLHSFVTSGLRKFMIPDLHRFATSGLSRFKIPDLHRFTTSGLRRFKIPDFRRINHPENLFHEFCQTRRFEGDWFFLIPQHRLYKQTILFPLARMTPSHNKCARSSPVWNELIIR
jgi:hypothetical protein